MPPPRRARADGVRLLASAVALTMAGALPLAQPARGPGAREDFAHLAEGYTSRRPGGPIEAGYRMFSAPDFGSICAAARAGDVRRLRTSTAKVSRRVGVPVVYGTLHVDALDASGALVPKVPIAIESERWSEVLDTQSDRIADGSVTPRASGTVRVRIRTLCDAPGGETFVTVIVTR